MTTSRSAAEIRAPGQHGLLQPPRTRQAVIPAAGVSCTARDLARFYQVLLRGGIAGDQEGARHQAEVSDAVIAAWN
jgi:CubicO group peptidase (beta-lactamase class C family)